MGVTMTTNQNELPWHVVEAAILKEKKWLLRVLDFGLRLENFSTSPLSADEILRQISISILRGDIHAQELNSMQVNGLWMDGGKNWEREHAGERHGGEWHRAMMAVVKNHFIENGFEVINEPYLNQGRADLGVYKSGYTNLYVEVGTTSLFKIWINLHTMPNSIFLFVPSEYCAIEFQTK